MADMVTFEIKGGEVVPEIRMPSSATILELKQKIEEDLNVKVARQTLLFNQINLNDEDAIADYGFHSMTSIRLSVTPEPDKEFFIDLKSGTRPTTNVRVKESYKVADLKSKLQRLWGIEKKNIALSRLSKKMEDDHFLYSYYIYEGTEVFAEIAINNSYGITRLK
ncbi:hypothetical protein AAG906_034957 [Vitis piasezkii]